MVSIYQYAGRHNGATLDIIGLSTDIKPIGEFKNNLIINGSTFLEMDTGDIYLYDEDNTKWHKI